MKSVFTRGTKVKVYEDPITAQRFEGIARLVKQESRDDFAPYLEQWTVNFIDDGFITVRTLKP